MINANGTLLAEGATFLNHQNRGLRYGDALFETLRVVNGTIYFWEDHYFRLMSSMRILRMEIPMEFTLEFLEKEILRTLEASQFDGKAFRARLTVFRNDGGLYTPATNEVSYVIDCGILDHTCYTISERPYEVELFKDHHVNTGMLSNLKSANKIINVVASVFANENGYQNCLLLNNSKMVVEAINGNLFLVTGNTIKTPPLGDGALDGILRKQLLAILQSTNDYEVVEASISPFELQKADELFVTNVVHGIQPITKYRKKEYGMATAKNMIGKLNAKARLV